MSSIITRKVGPFHLTIRPLSATAQGELGFEAVSIFGPALLTAKDRRDGYLSMRTIDDALAASHLLPVLNSEKRKEKWEEDMRAKDGLEPSPLPPEHLSPPARPERHPLDMVDAWHAGLVALAQGGRDSWRTKVLPLIHQTFGVGLESPSVTVIRPDKVTVEIRTASDVDMAFSGAGGDVLILAAAQVLEANLSGFFSRDFTSALAGMIPKSA